jgi:excisionase family DNA binding protein
VEANILADWRSRRASASYCTNSRHRNELARVREGNAFLARASPYGIASAPLKYPESATKTKGTEMFEQHLGRSVTIDQAATLLQVSRRTIYNRIRDGKLQTIRTIGGSQRVLVSSLEDNKRPSWTGIKFDSTPGDNSPES